MTITSLAIVEPVIAPTLPEPTSLGLTLPADTILDDWILIGRQLAAQEKVLNWWIGDWWAFGEHRYGERAKVAAEGVFGKAFQTLRNYGSVSRSIETSRRRDTVSWSHHAEVAALEPAKADALLERAEAEALSNAQLRAAVRVTQGREAEPRHTDDDSLLASFLRHWNRLPRDVRLEAADMIAEADGEEIEPA